MDRTLQFLGIARVMEEISLPNDKFFVFTVVPQMEPCVFDDITGCSNNATMLPIHIQTFFVPSKHKNAKFGFYKE